MPNLTISLPRIRRHKASGLAYVFLCGEQIYLGKFGSAVAQKQYDRVVAEWLANNRTLPKKPDQGITISALLVKYLRFAKKRYVKQGRITDEVYAIKSVCRVLRDMYGKNPANDFGPARLSAVRQRMIQLDWSRKHIGKQVSRVRRIFTWAASRELVDPSIPAGLECLEPLAKGEARETSPVKPVEIGVVDATVAELSTVVADMVRIQLLTGMRPTEVCLLRPRDIDRSNEVWLYKPARHKNEHYEQERVVYIGPRSQSVLLKYLLRSDDAYCFDPREAPKSRKNSKERYTKDSYGRAIRRAAERAGVETWSPNRLRHSRATEVRETFGLEAAQVTLGHAKASTTEIYAEKNAKLAAEVARKSG